MSLTPPHLIDPKGRPTPGSLIPFCAYNQKMSTLGKNLSGLSFPVCDQFKPVVKDGQVCYALDMSHLQPTKKGKTRRGRGFGVWLVINMEMSSKQNFFVPNEFLIKKNKSQSVTIHLSLLQEFTDVRAGVYGMTSLKKLTGTETFLGLPDDVKDCQAGDQKECKNDMFMEKVKKVCGCVPWSHGNRYKSGNFCSPADLSCVDNIEPPDDDEECRTSCTGLHAVVWHLNGTKDQEFWQKFREMEEEYKGYLNNYAENVEYSSSSKTLSKKILLNSNTYKFYLVSASPKKLAPLHLVQFYFVPATYDEIERDRKLTLEAQLGLIGGTMGLFTGFSIFSGVEIIYFAIKFFISLRVNRRENKM